MRRYTSVCLDLCSHVRELRLLLPAFAIAASALTFMEISELWQEEPLGLDVSILRALREAADPAQPVGPDWLRRAAVDLTALGGHSVIALMVAIVTGYLVLTKRMTLAVIVAGTAIGGELLNEFLKQLFARERPSVVPHFVEVVTASYPSGHAMLSAIVYPTLGALLAQTESKMIIKAYLIGVGALLAFMVGASRMYLGVHYPTDVVAGWTAGLGWACLCVVVARIISRLKTGKR